MTPKEKYDKLETRRQKLELQMQKLNAELQMKEFEYKEVLKKVKAFRKRPVGVMNL